LSRRLIKYLNGSADDLSSLRACTHYLPVGICVWAPPQHGLVRGLFRHLQYRGLRPGSACLICLRTVSYLDLLALLRPATHRTEYVGVRVQSLAYLGFRPADGLSAEFERWAMLCRIASVGCSLTRCTPPWRSERVVSHQCTPAGKINLFG
jgi:hypothetical protein